MVSWLEEVGDWFAQGAATASGLAAMAGLVAWVRGRYRATVGRRRLNYRKLRQLGPNTTLSYFRSFLGEAAFRFQGEDTVDHIFRDKDFYVVARVDAEDRVVSFSVTTRNRKFRPKLPLPGLQSGDRPYVVELGRSAFSDTPASPHRIVGSVGARRFSYWESYYFGNPGLYQTVVLALNDAGFVRADAAPIDLDIGGAGVGTETEIEQAIAREPLVTFRREAAVNTWAITAPFWEQGADPPPGPDEDSVRVLPE